jgi:hypothetical protein
VQCCGARMRPNYSLKRTVQSLRDWSCRLVQTLGALADLMRNAVVDELRLLSLPSEQLAYEACLTSAGHAPSELICRFCDDLYHPKSAEFVTAFSESELKALAHLYGLMCEAGLSTYASVTEMLKSPAWRRVVALAKDLHAAFGQCT